MSINKYKFLEKLSSGSFGFVYKGIRGKQKNLWLLKLNHETQKQIV